MSKLSCTEREIAERIISGLSEAIVTARADGRREGLGMAARALRELIDGLTTDASGMVRWTEVAEIPDAIRAMMEKEG